MSMNLTLVEPDRTLLLSKIAGKSDPLRDLLAVSSGAEYLLPHLTVVPLTVNQVLFEQGDRIDSLYFPLDSVISGLAIMEDGTTVETSMVGREGIVGISAILGSGRSRQWVWVSVSGNAIQLDARYLEKLFVNNEIALKSLLKCYRSLITQVSQ